MAQPNKAGARLSAPRLTQATRRVITGIWEWQHEPKGNVAKVPHIRQECRSLCDTCPYKFSGFPLKCSALERSVASLMLLPRQRFGLVLAFALPSHSAFSTNFLGAIPVPGTMHLYCEPCSMQYQTKPHPKQNLCAPPLQHHGSRQSQYHYHHRLWFRHHSPNRSAIPHSTARQTQPLRQQRTRQRHTER